MEIRDAYNEWSQQYDSNQNKTRDLDQEATIKSLAQIKFNNVLELGCGTGKNTEWLSASAKQLTALDFSEGMLALAKTKVAGRNVQFCQADLTKQWPVPNDSYDLACCNLVLEHIADLNFIFSEAQRALKAGGLFFISELHPFKQYTGSGAKYQTPAGTQNVDVHIHSISEFIGAAFNHNFRLTELREWNHPLDQSPFPRLLTMLYQKEN